MPLFPVNNTKIISLNENKTSGVIFEYPSNMGNGEVLDRVNELRDSLVKSINETKEEKKEPVIEPVVEEIKV